MTDTKTKALTALEAFTEWADAEYGPTPDPHIPQHERFASYWRCWQAAQQPAQPAASAPTRDEIRAIFLANGFKLKEADDLRPYVYDAAYALIQRVLERLPTSVTQPAQQEQDRIDEEL